MKRNTRIDKLVPWHPHFDKNAAMFEPLRPWIARFRHHTSWPGLDAYQELLDSLDQPPCTHKGVALKVVAQDGKPNHFEQHYAPRIYLHGEIQTRTQNWHDFFQLLTWIAFPKTKAAINAIHIPRAEARLKGDSEPGRRSPIENMLSLFDEGGAILVSSDETLFQLVRDFQWKQLFWSRRNDLTSRFECITFGHALYEKGLKPYLGMTANTIMMTVDDEFFLQPLEKRLSYLDQALAELLEAGDKYQKPRDLDPFPILGLPGWDPQNTRASYYDNRDYFRPGRRRT